MSSVSSKSSVARVPWSPWGGVGFVLLVFVGSQILASVAVELYPLFKHWSNQQTTNWLNNSVPAQFTYILLAETFVVGAIYLFVRHYKKGMSLIGLRRPRWSDPAYGVAAVLPYFVLYILTVGVVSSLVSGLNVNQQQQLGFNNVQGGPDLLLTFISLVILPPIAEEIMVRGFLYSSLKKALPTAWAVLLTSALFAAAHLPEGGAAGPLWIAALDTFVLSLVLIYLREKTGGLWASMTLHAIKNGIAFTALFALHAR
jgi:membrane protease YdiL (CAAX protease family)